MCSRAAGWSGRSSMTRRAITTGASAPRSTWPPPTRRGVAGRGWRAGCETGGGLGKPWFVGRVRHHEGVTTTRTRPVLTPAESMGAMRLIHTSDWHLGRTLHGENLLEHQAAFLGWLLARAVSHRVDAVVVAGDVYDRAVPSTDAVALLDATLLAFARERIPVVITSGNHDSPIRLGFGAGLSEAAGIHLRTSVADIARPVIVADDPGVYGVPYLLPDAVMAELGAQRSHASVLSAAAQRIRADAAGRGLRRTVVAAHALITGGAVAESERDIRVGGIGDAPASVFDGFTYVALGHLHGQQQLPAGRGTTARYSGSPLAFSFSEAAQAKSVTLAEIDAAGRVAITLLPAPV